MGERQIEDYGNKLTIVGFLLGNEEETDIVLLPDKSYVPNVTIVAPTEEELVKIFHQLDTSTVTNFERIVLRKSQRNIDQRISWSIFRRDNFKCVYCGDTTSPLTVDHLVLWEDYGPTVQENLVAACSKCNKTRGSKSVPQFIDSEYYNGLKNPNRANSDGILAMWEEAKKLPLRKPRSR